MAKPQRANGLIRVNRKVPVMWKANDQTASFLQRFRTHLLGEDLCSNKWAPDTNFSFSAVI